MSAGKRIYPDSLTGKGAVHGGSVLDHAFGTSDPYTLGVEEEYMLLDGSTFDLVQHIDTVLAAIEGHELETRITSELMQSVLEIATPVCRTADDVMRELTKLRRYVTGIAREKGLRVASAGTHPFSLFERQRITARDRYRKLVDQLQYVARRELIFGMHIHVAVDDPDKAIQVVNGLLPQLAPLLALSASSPFWRGEPTGLASSRQMVFSAFPRSGPPPRFRDYADYAEVVGQLERTGCIADYTHIWWDIRLHARLGTIEIRICDAVTRVEDAVALTAYCQALVKLLCERYEAGEKIPSYHRILTSENKWLAARYGLEAPVMDLATGRRNRIPVAQLVRRTLKEITPHARELGSERELGGVREILSRGNGADRQLRVFNANRDIVEVAQELAEATEALPSPCWSPRPRRPHDESAWHPLVEGEPLRRTGPPDRRSRYRPAHEPGHASRQATPRAPESERRASALAPALARRRTASATAAAAGGGRSRPRPLPRSGRPRDLARDPARRRPLPRAALPPGTARPRRATTFSSAGPSGSPGTSSSAARRRGRTRTRSGPRRRRRRTSRAGCSGLPYWPLDRLFGHVWAYDLLLLATFVAAGGSHVLVAAGAGPAVRRRPRRWARLHAGALPGRAEHRPPARADLVPAAGDAAPARAPARLGGGGRARGDPAVGPAPPRARSGPALRGLRVGAPAGDAAGRARPPGRGSPRSWALVVQRAVVERLDRGSAAARSPRSSGTRPSSRTSSRAGSAPASRSSSSSAG